MASSPSSIISNPIRLVLETTCKNSIKLKSKNPKGTNTINSSHYVDFCTDPTTGFSEFNPELCKNNGKIIGREKMLSPWLLQPTTCTSSTVHPVQGSSSNQIPAQAQISSPFLIPKMPLIRTQAHAHAQPPPPSRNPCTCPLTTPRTGPGLGLDSAPSNRLHPHCEFSSSSASSPSLSPWEWPRRSRPTRSSSRDDLNDQRSNRLFFYPINQASNSNSNASTSSCCTGPDLGSSSVSVSTSASSMSTKSYCQLHSAQNLTPTYRIRSYSNSNGGKNGFGFGENNEFCGPGICCRRKGPSLGSKGWFMGWSNGGKRQALRTFQLICSLLCALGIITLLVISIISSSRSTILVPIQNEDGRLVFTSGSSGMGLESDPENSPNSPLTLSIRDQLKAWLFKNPAATAISNLDSSHAHTTTTSSQSQLLNITNFKFVLNNDHICGHNVSSHSHSRPSSNHSTSIYFMILVHSAPAHFQQRQAIRSTWGSVKSIRNLGIRLVFLLGQLDPPIPDIKFTRKNPAHLLQRNILNEQGLYGDIVQGNFHDTYHNLIYKHLMGYRWISSHCPSPATTFVLKTDDDVFIDIFQLFEFTTRTYGYTPSNTIVCNVFEGTGPIRPEPAPANSSAAAGSKWTVDEREYPLELYPKYCGGLAYLITPDVIGNLLAINDDVTAQLNANNQTLRFWIDDVYVTGVLRELIGREPYYLNLRYAYDTKQYQPWMNDFSGAAEEKVDGGAGGKKAGRAEAVVEDFEFIGDGRHGHLYKIPYMIVHLEQTSVLSEEMNRLWRKTMRVWH